MSRSKKQTPKTSITTSETEKKNKQDANRKLRRIIKIQLKQEEDNLSKLREVSNIWSFDKDGKKYLINPSDKDLRK